MTFFEQAMILLVAPLGAIITFYISVYLQKGNVLASAVVVLSAGILEFVFPGFFTPQVAGALTAASYAGMVSGEKIKDMKEMLVIGGICGLLVVSADNAYVGLGGRLGTLAAISCGTYFGCKMLWQDVLSSTINFTKQWQ